MLVRILVAVLRAEYAPKIIKAGGIAAILAKSFARIFYRNAINLGLPLIEGDTDQINEGDLIRVDLSQGKYLMKQRVIPSLSIPCRNLWFFF